MNKPLICEDLDPKVSKGRPESPLAASAETESPADAHAGSKPLICFDWDGTLCDSMELCIQENRMVLERLGLPPVDEATLRRCNGPTFEEAAPMLGVPADRMAEYCRKRLECALSLVPKVNRLFPGAKELLAALRPHAELAIVSNGTAEYIARCKDLFGLHGVFCRTVTSHPERTKAKNLAVLLADMRPGRAVMVGDRLGDIRAGRANGLPTIAACLGYGGDTENAEADMQAQTMQELQQMLLDFCRK